MMSARPAKLGLTPPVEEMARLTRAGFSLLPLGGGADGKSPLLSFKGVDALPLRRVLGPMHAKGSGCYGIRLNGLAVIDCDECDTGLIKDMEARFGASPVHVRTPRGVHLYYRAGSGTPPNLRGEGLPVDVKRGGSGYVVGPQSVRPDGGSYDPTKGVLGVDKLPVLRLPTSSCKVGKVAVGSRNKQLTHAAIKMVESVDDPDELFGNLKFIRDDECEDPDTVPDRELRGIANWAWTKRLEGKVYHARDSEFRVDRQALVALKGAPNASDAIALLVTLQAAHGHIAGKAFALNHGSMRAAGQTDLTRRRFLAARRALENRGLLRIASHHRAGHSARKYQLGRIRSEAADQGNILGLPSKGERGEGFINYICRPVLVQRGLGRMRRLSGGNAWVQ